MREEKPRQKQRGGARERETMHENEGEKDVCSTLYSLFENAARLSTKFRDSQVLRHGDICEAGRGCAARKASKPLVRCEFERTSVKLFNVFVFFCWTSRQRFLRWLFWGGFFWGVFFAEVVRIATTHKMLQRALLFDSRIRGSRASGLAIQR